MATRTPRDLIERWPSLEALATDTGASLLAVRKWPQRKRIPPKYWPRVVRSAGGRGIKGVTFDALERMHADAAEARA